MNPHPATPAPGGEEADLLRRRAEQLARRLAAPQRDAGEAEALAFELAGQECLLELQWVREVRALGELLPVPLAPAPLLGLAHLRGRMLPVLDLRALLGIAGSGPWQPRQLLVLGREAPDLGIAVSRIDGLQPLAAAAAQRRSEPLQGMRPELVRGLGPRGQLLLDGERLLALQQEGSP